MRTGSARFVLAVVMLLKAHTLAQKDVEHHKPPASMLPPAPFVTTTPQTTTAHPTTHHTTTAKMTTTAPTPHNTTTANVTTAPPTPHNTTTANVTTAPPTPHNTTTANVTTAPPTPHNTTTANVTTTAHITTLPPPMPTPKTNVTVGNYTVLDGNKLCIMVQAAIQITVKDSKMANTYIVPGKATSSGKCEKNTSSIWISMPDANITMNFTRNDTSNVVFVSAVAVKLSYAFSPGVLSNLSRNNDSVQLFSMATGHSYSCKSESVFLGNDTYLEFSSQKMQAFNFTNNQFGADDLCKADQPHYQVAIAVGVVLIILIVIVLLAYLISRRKRTAGYQTL